MSAPAPANDLLDLKLLPSWVKESPGARDYSNFEGEEHDGSSSGRERRPPSRGNRRPDRPRGDKRRDGPPQKRRPQERPARRDDQRRPETTFAPPPAVTVRFSPVSAALENVIAQIKAGTAAYSVYALARLFLEKPERYDVQIVGAAETPLFQLGEKGPVASDRRLLEGSAFALQRENFYKIEVTQADPIKGNFTNVARDRASGTLLGPTNHHGYQTQLRQLFEQRYSRRMSFADFQRQIEIVSDPAIVEQWKEQARSVTTFSTLEDPPVVLQNATEAERHFRQNYLPTLIQPATDLHLSGVVSRRLPDRALGRVIEDAWSQETRSPSNMMQELSGSLRQAGLHIFRHRRGMLFVSPVRVRFFKHELANVSPTIGAILAAITETPGIHRKELAEKLIPAGTEATESERAKMTLASDLKWLISEGYLIEFNDGSLDLPRAKTPAAATRNPEALAERPGSESALPNERDAAPAPAVVSEENSAAVENMTNETEAELPVSEKVSSPDDNISEAPPPENAEPG